MGGGRGYNEVKHKQVTESLLTQPKQRHANTASTPARFVQVLLHNTCVLVVYVTNSLQILQIF